jgi:hypothetical protein
MQLSVRYAATQIAPVRRLRTLLRLVAAWAAALDYTTFGPVHYVSIDETRRRMEDSVAESFRR